MARDVRVWAKLGCAVVVTLLASTLAIAQAPASVAPAPTIVAKLVPDLVVTKVGFQFVKHLTGNVGTCDLFNVVPTIANLDKGSARAFKVLLEWNRGAGGAFVPACPACFWEVPGLAGGATQTLEPRQFNNCDGALTFKVTADSGNAVLESNEHNNSKVAAYIARNVRQR